MAVYFAPKQPNYWGRAAAEIGTGLLGKFVFGGYGLNGQHKAKTIERNRSLYLQTWPQGYAGWRKQGISLMYSVNME